MTDKEIIAVWCQTPAHGIVEFARALLKAERDACAEACKAVQCRNISGASYDYMTGKEMAVKQCVDTLLARNDLPAGD